MTTTSRTLAVLAFITVTAALGAAPQQPQQPVRDNLSSPTGAGVLSGVVVTDDSSSRPLRRAVVRISGGDIRLQPVSLTDNNGRFIFANLPAGRFTLSVSKPGYVTTYYGAKRPGISALGLPIALTEGQKVTTLQVRVMHGGAITGTLRDENGRPLPNSSVSVAGVRMVKGRLMTEYTQSSGSGQTDDRGVYRVYGLAPGSYVVFSTSNSFMGNSSQRLTTDEEVKWAERRVQAAAQGMVSSGADLAASAPPPPGRPVAYTAVYYPGVVDPQTATIVTTGPNEERSGIDFAMRLVPTARVDGVVLGLDGQPAANAQVQLVGGTSQGMNDLASMMMLEMMMINVSRPGAGGKFSFAALKPGEYTVTARASSKTAPEGAPAGRGAAPAPPVMDLWAETAITVDGNDLSDITLTLQPGMTISGRVVFDGALPPPDVTKVRVSLQLPPSSGPRMGIPQATVNADGSFELTGVTPGAYRIDAYAPGVAMTGTPTWSLRSASLKGQNLTDAPFEVRPNDSLSGVTVTFTDKTTEVSGTLFDSAGRPAPEYYVMVYPADRKQWFSGARALHSPVRPDSTGKFTIPSLPAGDYYICALPDFEQNTLSDPSFLEQLVPGSIKFSLAEGEKRKQDMKLAGGGF